MVDNWSIFEQLRSRWRQALGFAVRPSCLLCRAEGQAAMDLCALCAALLPRPAAGMSAGRIRAADTASAHPPAPGCVLQLAALRYAWPVDLLVQELKFGGSWPVARIFGQLLASARRDVPMPLPQVVIPVPLHPLRLAERGFNQAEHIARFAAEELRLRLAPPLLQRRRNTAVQSRLNAAARRDNLREAFQIDEHSRHMPVEPWEHVALVDDVLTTGSTLAAATTALRRVGVRRIEWWTAAAASLGATEPAPTASSAVRL